MRLRHIVAALLFAFGTSFLVRRAQVMITVIFNDADPKISYFGLTVYYTILFSLLLLLTLAIGLDPVGPDDIDDSKDSR